MRKIKVLYITATDTGVGKTVTAFVLGVLLKAKGYNVGVMKPVQCAGNDAEFLKKGLRLDDDMALINPFYAPEPLSPHLAFRRAKIRFDQQRVQACLKELSGRHEVMIIEGAGGLMVPLKNSYYNADLIADLKAELIIVSRPGLGTINHTLLTIREAQRRQLKIKGVIFCQARPVRQGIAEKTNPKEIENLSGVNVIGTLPYLNPLNQRNILKHCSGLALYKNCL